MVVGLFMASTTLSASWLWVEEGKARRQAVAAQQNEERLRARSLLIAQRGEILLNETLAFLEERDWLSFGSEGLMANQLGAKLHRAGSYAHAETLFELALQAEDLEQDGCSSELVTIHSGGKPEAEDQKALL